MKKLLLLLFSLLLSFNSYGDDEVCFVRLNDDTSLRVFPSTVEYEKLLTVCDKGDIARVSGFDYGTKMAIHDMADFITSYCDLTETQIVANYVLVCRLVKYRD